MYNKTTVLNLLETVLLAFATALITKKNTRIGAIDFNAPTKISPKIPIAEAFGKISPKITPRTNPQAIRKINDKSFHFFKIRFTITPKKN
jgi:hypothetical protein